MWIRNETPKQKQERYRAYYRKYYYKNRSKRLAYDKIYSKNKRAKERGLVLEKYGGMCACCGEKEQKFITLDHINNDGNSERAKHGIGGIYKLAIKENFPKRYQLLCWNCNMAKGRYGKCPHKK